MLSDSHDLLEVELSADETQAFATVRPPDRGGRPATEHDVRARLERAGVVTGILEAHIRAAVIQAAVEHVVVYRALIAQGELVEDPVDARVRWHIDPDGISGPLPERAPGVTDFAAIPAVRFVRAGSPLATVTPARAGRPGRAITAERAVVHPRAAQHAPIGVGDGVTASADGQELHASVDGIVQYTQGRLSVWPFALVDGSLGPGEHTHSGGVIVNGDVAGATITAGGIVAILGAVDGAAIRSHGDVYLASANGTRIRADGSLYWTGCLAHCDIVVGDRMVGSDNAQIRGGELSALASIEAGSIGDPSFAETHLRVGLDGLRDLRHAELTEEIEKCQQAMTTMDATLNAYSGAAARGLSDAKRAVLNELRARRAAVCARATAIRGELRRMAMGTVEVEAHVSASESVHPGVWIQIREAEHLVEVQHGAIAFRASGCGRSVVVLPNSVASTARQH